MDKKIIFDKIDKAAEIMKERVSKEFDRNGGDIFYGEIDVWITKKINSEVTSSIKMFQSI